MILLLDNVQLAGSQTKIEMALVQRELESALQSLDPPAADDAVEGQPLSED